MRKHLPALFLCLLCAFTGCKKDKDSTIDQITTGKAVVSGISPSIVTAGTVVTITGENFESAGTTLTVYFNGVPATVQSINATEIRAVVPLTGSGTVTLKISNTTIYGPAFTYAASVSAITGIAPSTGTQGSIVSITGTNLVVLGNSVQVFFNGVAGRIQSVTTTEIKVEVPVTTTGNITLTTGNQTMSGPVFTYFSPLTSTYVSGNVTLTTQAEVDAFVTQNKGRQLQITGNLSIQGNDINSLSGLSIITEVTGSLSITACPLLHDASFLNNITSAGNITFQNLDITALTMDKLTLATGGIAVSACKNLSSLGFRSLNKIAGSPILGSLRITTCNQLADIDANSLTTATYGIYLSGTALTDLSKFSALQSAGSLTLSANTSLTSLHGLERLTTLSLAPFFNVMGAVSINGLYITGNAKMNSLAALQNLTSVPVARITNNAILNDFCPMKVLLVKLSTQSPYPYKAGTNIWDVYTTKYVAALALTNNGNYVTTQNTLDVIALCK